MYMSWYNDMFWYNILSYGVVAWALISRKGI